MMMRIEIKLDNAAFDGSDCGNEIAWMLLNLETRIAGHYREDLKPAFHGYKLFDCNGNAAGKVTIISNRRTRGNR